MRIAMTSDTYWPRVNGVAISIDCFKGELNREGHQAVVLASQYPMTEEQKKKYDNETVIRFPSLNPLISREDRIVWPWMKGRFFRYLDGFKPDIIHTQTELMTGYFGRLYAKKHGIPYVMTCHTYFEQYISYYVPWMPRRLMMFIIRKLTTGAFNKADVIIVPSGHMQKVLQDYGVDRPFYVIPTGLDPRDFAGVSKEEEKKNSELFQKYPWLKGRKILLFVGRVGQEKNMDFLLDMVKKLKTRYDNFTLLIVGGGPYKDPMEKMVKTHGLEKHVVLTGYWDRSKIKNIYTLADVFTFASKTETQGLVTIEAMLCHTPAVAIGVMGTKEVMNGDNGGYMVPDDLEVFTSKVEMLLKDEKLLKAKSDEAYQYAQNWTVEVMTHKLIAVYESVIKEYTRPKKQGA